jgi:hypothetical protein
MPVGRLGWLIWAHAHRTRLPGPSCQKVKKFRIGKFRRSPNFSDFRRPLSPLLGVPSKNHESKKWSGLPPLCNRTIHGLWSEDGQELFAASPDTPWRGGRIQQMRELRGGMEVQGWACSVNRMLPNIIGSSSPIEALMKNILHYIHNFTSLVCLRLTFSYAHIGCVGMHP